VFSPIKPYAQVIPLTLRATRDIPFVYLCSQKQRDYILSFFQGVGGSGDWLWRPMRCVPAPEGLLPTLGANVEGALGARVYYVRFSWYDVVSGEETTPSQEASIAVAANSVATVTVPHFPNNVPSFRIYASTTEGDPRLQGFQSSGRTWIEPPTGLLTGGAVPKTVNNLRPNIKLRLVGNVAESQLNSRKFRMSFTAQELEV